MCFVQEAKNALTKHDSFWLLEFKKPKTLWQSMIDVLAAWIQEAKKIYHVLSESCVKFAGVAKGPSLTAPLCINLRVCWRVNHLSIWVQVTKRSSCSRVTACWCFSLSLAFNLQCPRSWVIKRLHSAVAEYAGAVLCNARYFPVSKQRPEIFTTMKSLAVDLLQ